MTNENTSTANLGGIFAQEARHSSPWAVVCIAGWSIIWASVSLFRQNPLLTAVLALASWSLLVGSVVSIRRVGGIDRTILESNRRMVWLISGETFLGFVVLLSVLLFGVPVVVLPLCGVVLGVGSYYFSR